MKPEQSATLGEQENAELSLWELAAQLVRFRRQIAVVALATPLITIAAILLLPRSFTTTVSFKPQGGAMGAAQLSTLASQFGVRVPTAGEDDTPEFYVALLQSHEVLDRLAARTYQLMPGVVRSLDEVLELTDDDPMIRRDESITWLREEAIDVKADPVSALVTVSVQTESAQLSEQIAAACLEEVNRFNSERRRTIATEERAFVESRLSESEARLRAAEQQLQSFLENNRMFESSPQLRLEYERLQRVVALQQQLTVSLATAFEQARIGEVKSTPLISVVQSAYVPARPDRRRLLIKAIIALFFGLALGVSGVAITALVLPRTTQDRRALDNIVAALPRSITALLPSRVQHQ